MIRAALLVGLALLAGPRLAAQPADSEPPRYEAYWLPDVPPPSALPASPGPADTTETPPDEWLGRDKALHFGASFLLTLSGQYVLVDKAELSNGRALPISASTALALGLLKEIADSQRRQHPLFSWRDLAADAAGIVLAAAVVAW